jgi:DNA-binding NarL/FixJ family response regulator
MNISVAIVEDLDEVRQGLHDFIVLKPEFYVIGVYKTAEGAIQELPLLKPDIVIMDINLPGVNGIECIKQLKQKIPHTQFMMFTVYENDENVFEALKAGATGYLLKDTEMAQITEALKDLHNGGSPMSRDHCKEIGFRFFKNNKKKMLPLTFFLTGKMKYYNFSRKGLLYKEISEKLAISVNHSTSAYS